MFNEIPTVYWISGESRPSTTGYRYDSEDDVPTRTIPTNKTPTLIFLYDSDYARYGDVIITDGDTHSMLTLTITEDSINFYISTTLADIKNQHVHNVSINNNGISFKAYHLSYGAYVENTIYYNMMFI